jgi:hypothetical protein
MPTRHHLALAVLAAATLAACSDAPATVLEADPPASTVAVAPPQITDTAKGGTPASGGRSDTTATGPAGPVGTGTPADTSRPTNFPAAVRVYGRLLMSSVEASAPPRDTLSSFAPVAGARITLFRNLLIDGKGVSQRIGEVTTGADGSYAFEGVPGGYYVLALNVTPDRPWGTNVAYAIGNRPELEVTMRFWRMPDAPTGGATTPPDSSKR